MQRKTKDCGQPSGPGREMWKWFSQNLQFEPTLQTLRSGTSSLQNYTRIHFCYAKSLSLWWGFCLFVLFFYSSLRRPAQVPCKGWLQQSFSIGLGSMVKGESFPWKVGCSVSWAWYRSDLLQAATTQSGQLSQKDAGNLKRRLLHTQKLYCHSQRKPGLWWTKMEVSLSMQISNYRAKEMRNLWQSSNTGDGRMILQICVSCSSALSGGALGNEASREQWRFIICRCRQLATDALWKNGMKWCSISFSMRYYHLYDYYFHQVDTLSTKLIFPERISSLEWIPVFFYQILRINAYPTEHVFGILRGILGKIYSAIF